MSFWERFWVVIGDTALMFAYFAAFLSPFTIIGIIWLCILINDVIHGRTSKRERERPRRRTT
jgi:hypothetical protein